MNNTVSSPILIGEDDFNLLRTICGKLPNSDQEMSLANEMKRATVLKPEELPADVVRLNSRVTVLDLETQKVREFTIVMPASADMKLNKISIVSPIGTALLGYRKASEVEWKVPAGMKRFRILDVVNLKK